jgi:hypothetical protein
MTRTLEYVAKAANVPRSRARKSLRIPGVVIVTTATNA